MANNNHFDLTLDTLAPENCKISRPYEYGNTNQNLTLSADNATYMKVWFDQEATPTAAPDDAAWEAYATSKITDFKTEGIYYYHVIYMDDVNNESAIVSTEAITFETTAPEVTAAVMSDTDTGSTTYTNNQTVNISFSFADTGTVQSGVKTAKITGDLDGGDITIDTLSGTSYSGTLKLTSTDELKTISITVTDQAGNTSDPVTTSITLDTGISAVTMTLLDKASSEGKALSAYINYHAIGVELDSVDKDIVGYKIWEDGTTEPADYTKPATGTDYFTFPIYQALTLSDNDGLKTVHAKIIDRAGSVATATDKTVTIDTVKPVVSLESNKTIISNISSSVVKKEDFTTATLTLSGTDATAGIKSWDILCGETSIKGSLTAIPETFALTSANSMNEGENTITLTVTDNAENTNTATVKVTLDTTAPTEVSINSLDTWYNTNFSITANGKDSNTMKYWYAWTSTTATDTSVPSNAIVVDYASSPQTLTADQIVWNLAQSASNYMHLAAVDSVGNVTYAHAKFGYDSLKPNKPTISFSQSIYASTTASVTIVATDQGTSDYSGVAYMMVTGDIQNPDTDWVEFSATKSVTLTTGDGYKKVYVQVKDLAGNVSDQSEAAQCELDTTTPSGTITLFEADGTTAKAAHSSVAEFVAHITYTDDEIVGKMQYKLYNDFTYDEQKAQGITEDDVEWQDFAYDSGKTYMTVSNMFCTSNSPDTESLKTIYLKVKDEAGHVSDAIPASFYYDNSKPVVEVSGIDFNRISKVASLRRTNATTLGTVNADTMNFKFDPDDKIQAYKVCAYMDSTAAKAVTDPASETAIGTANGSVNMSGTGLSSDAEVSCTINGCDFEIALGGTGSRTTHGEKDGGHIVVVYVQNLAGLWSAIAEFDA